MDLAPLKTMSPSLPLSLIRLSAALLTSLAPLPVLAESLPSWQRQMNSEATAIEAAAARELEDPAEWMRNAPVHRKELLGMLGLDPLPERTALKAVTVGTLENAAFTVEKIHFQSSPGLYVTGNLYVPKQRSGPLPAILYVCGHSVMKEGGISFGNKTGYQHHPAWFAQNGFIALVIDTIQLGEIQGLHHGTHNLNLWWWNSRGYTPAGVETWNGIRALDYLQSRPEVDPSRLGVTGRSGGGAYSWYIAAVDERIKAAVPVAGITDMHNYIIDGVIDGHCDCMYPVNALRWDFSKVAALVAPRALLLTNTDKDPIFPLDGVQRIHHSVSGLYRGLKAQDKLGLLIAEGPHKDIQELQVGAFRWFKRFLANNPDYPIQPATKFFTPAELRVFTQIPADERTTTTHEWFVPKADSAQFPTTSEGWRNASAGMIAKIRSTSFAAWPGTADACPIQTLESLPCGRGTLAQFRVQADPSCAEPGDTSLVIWGKPERVAQFSRHLSGEKPGAEKPPLQLSLQIVDDAALGERLAAFQSGSEPPSDTLQLLFAPRGFSSASNRSISPSNWAATNKELTRIRRRFMLTGSTLDAARVFDIVQILKTLRTTTPTATLELRATGTQGVNALYATLFSEGIASLSLEKLPASHETPTAPDYLSILRVVDIAQTLELARTRTSVQLLP